MNQLFSVAYSHVIIHSKDVFFSGICIILNAVSEKNNASTCIREIALATRSKIASFQNLLPANN
jgi:hypothetical protein